MSWCEKSGQMKICSETATRQVIGEEYSRLKEECDLGFKQLRAKMCMEYLGCSHWLISLPIGKKSHVPIGFFHPAGGNPCWEWWQGGSFYVLFFTNGGLDGSNPRYILRKHFFQIHMCSKTMSKLVCLTAVSIGLTIQFISVCNNGHRYANLEGLGNRATNCGAVGGFILGKTLKVAIDIW